MKFKCNCEERMKFDWEATQSELSKHAENAQPNIWNVYERVTNCDEASVWTCNYSYGNGYMDFWCFVKEVECDPENSVLQEYVSVLEILDPEQLVRDTKKLNLPNG